MKLFIKQKLFSWFDSYNVYDEQENIIYIVKGSPSWGHRLHISDPQGNNVGTVQERVLTLLPKFELYLGDVYAGCISKEFSFFFSKYQIDCNGWQISGDLFDWDFEIKDKYGNTAVTISKQLWNFTDTYCIDVARPEDMLLAMMTVLAIDAERCSG